ncbi:hypothetical protein OG689_42945 [Kitasatospora sp. NBC_00240]|uniref:hypothetical protein n=1 Tax=Kitasatospora sp. NBC_00240 TaxID=2903567 RepID=UPI00225702FE|nr:hypothetical protein [Kitasatospora sp. NBC_00240]MCX5215902.1 hypothetical protein [Kitasatospora sp. NBC_00240]
MQNVGGAEPALVEDINSAPATLAATTRPKASSVFAQRRTHEATVPAATAPNSLPCAVVVVGEQELPVLQIHTCGSQTRPILQGCRHPLRRQRAGRSAARTLAGHQPVLGHLQADPLGQIEDLTPLDPDLLRAGQVRPTAGTRPLRTVLDLAVRVGDLPQRDSGLPLRTARTAPGLSSQRLRRGLRQPVQGRRLRGDFEFCPSRASRSACRAFSCAFWDSSSMIRARAAASSTRNSTTNGASSSYDGDWAEADTALTMPDTLDVINWAIKARDPLARPSRWRGIQGAQQVHERRLLLRLQLKRDR